MKTQDSAPLAALKRPYSKGVPIVGVPAPRKTEALIWDVARLVASDWYRQAVRRELPTRNSPRSRANGGAPQSPEANSIMKKPPSPEKLLYRKCVPIARSISPPEGWREFVLARACRKKGDK